jgi:quercetin dioxygenase-like cupin family protein
MKRIEFIKTTVTLSALLAAAPSMVLAKVKRIGKYLSPKIVRQSDGSMINVLGDHQTFKLTGKDTNGLFTLIESFNEPGTAIPMHIHENEDEVFKVLEGQMELTVGKTKTILRKGDLAFAPRNIPHSWRIIGETKAKVILSIFPAGLEVMFEELSELPPGPPDFSKIASVVKEYGISFVPMQN